jgi:hypothetical protein
VVKVCGYFHSKSEHTARAYCKFWCAKKLVGGDACGIKSIRRHTIVKV